MNVFTDTKVPVLVSIISVLGIAGFILVLALGGPGNIISGRSLQAAAAAADLSTADNFAILAGSAVSDAGGSVISGDLGLSPASGSFITGLLAAQVSGAIYAVDAAGPASSIEDPGLLVTVKSDLVTAYNDVASQGPDAAISAIGGGQTLTPGVYNSASSILFTGSLTLDAGGDPNAVFVFQAGSTLTTGSASTVVLAGGAQACNVFWQVGSSATLGSGSNFKGTILAMDSITDESGSTVEGRLLARNASVTLNDTHITVPSCSHPPANATLHVVKVVENPNGGTATSSDFTMHVLAFGVDVAQGSSAGTISPGTSYSLPAGDYVVNEDDNVLYEASFGDDCDADGTVTLSPGDDKTCTVTNTDIPAVEESVSGGSSGGSSRRRSADLSIASSTLTTITSVAEAAVLASTTAVTIPVGVLPSFPNTGLSPRGIAPLISSLFYGVGSVQVVGARAAPVLPARLRIPVIGLDAAVRSVGLTPHGAIDVPASPHDAAWFDQGPVPGKEGTAIIDGHFGWKGGTPAVFDRLSELREGDAVYVEDEDGALVTFIVRELRNYNENEDAPEAFGSSDGKAHLNLITCTGIWNESRKSYSGRLVVFADEE